MTTLLRGFPGGRRRRPGAHLSWPALAPGGDGGLPGGRGGCVGGLAAAFRGALAHRATFSYAKACLVAAANYLTRPVWTPFFRAGRIDLTGSFARRRSSPPACPGVCRSGPPRPARSTGWSGPAVSYGRVAGRLDGRPADAVALACVGQAGGGARLVTLVKVWRPDLAGWRADLGRAGWSLRLPRAPACRLAVFAVDADRGQLRPLRYP